MKPGRRARKMMKRQLRRTRRRSRRIRKRTRRLRRGRAAILLIGGTAIAIKLLQNDIDRIEEDTGKSADDLTEEELLAAMKKLGIQKLELDGEDEDAIAEAEEEQSDGRVGNDDPEHVLQTRSGHAERHDQEENCNGESGVYRVHRPPPRAAMRISDVIIAGFFLVK